MLHSSLNVLFILKGCISGVFIYLQTEHMHKSTLVMHFLSSVILAKILSSLYQPSLTLPSLEHFQCFLAIHRENQLGTQEIYVHFNISLIPGETTVRRFRDRIEDSLCLSKMKKFHGLHLSVHKGEKQANTHFSHFISTQFKYVSCVLVGLNP